MTVTVSIYYLSDLFYIQSDISKARNRFFLLFGYGLLAMFGSRQIIIQGASLSGAGPLGVLCVAFIGVQKWDEEEKVSMYSGYLLCGLIFFLKNG